MTVWIHKDDKAAKAAVRAAGRYLTRGAYGSLIDVTIIRQASTVQQCRAWWDFKVHPHKPFDRRSPVR